MNSRTSFWFLTLSMAAFTLLIHLFTCTNYELHRDELLYMALGQHLSAGYMSTPPMPGVVACLIQHIYPQSELAIKLLPISCGVASVIVVALMARQLGGKNFAVFAACLAYIISPAFLRSDSLLMPVAFDEFYWLLLAYLTLLLVTTGNPKLWLVIGLAAGLAFLNKYSILFFALSLFGALLLSPHRQLLRSKYLWLGVLVAGVLVSPNSIWQAQHHFPVITHMGELRRTQLVNENPFTFIMGQLLMNIPCLLIWLTGLLGLLFLKAESRFRFIGLAYLFTVVLLMLGKGKAYYALGAYPMLFAAGGYIMEKYFTGKLWWLRLAYLALAVAFGIFILPLALPILSLEKMETYCQTASRFIGNWPTRWEDGKNHKIPQDYADMTGWKELAAIVAKAYSSLDTAAQNHCLIYANNYGQAAAILYYDKPLGLPDPVCTNDAFLFWAPDSVDNTTLITTARNTNKISWLYDEYTLAGMVNNPYFREDSLQVYICRKPKANWRSYYSNNIKQLKAEFSADR